MTTNATWQAMKPEVAIVSCSLQCLQMKTLLAGDRNMFCKKTAGRMESKNTETSCWHDGHLAIFSLPRRSIMDRFCHFEPPRIRCCGRGGNEPWRRFVKGPVRGDWPGTIKGHAIASRIFRSESVSIPLLERVEESFGAHQPASINAGDFIGNTAHFAIPCALPQMHATKQSAEQTELVSLFGGVQTESGRALLELIDESPVLLIFLRHFGCAFCRQALDQVSKIRDQIAARRTRPVFVHLGTKERAKLYFDYYNLSDVERVGNPDASLYQHPLFALGRINPYLQLFNPAVIKGWVKGAMRRYGIGMIHEDAHQMPGIFFLQDRRIVRGFRYQSIADEPDYVKLIDG